MLIQPRPKLPFSLPRVRYRRGNWLKDDFTTNRSAGSVNGTPAEPGPGTRTVLDGNGVLSLSSGRAVFSGSPVNNNGLIYTNGIPRAPGRLLRFTLPTGTAFGNGNERFGFLETPATGGAVAHAWSPAIANINFIASNNSGGIDLRGAITPVPITLAIVLQAAGAYFFRKYSGGSWKYCFYDAANAASPLYVAFRFNTNALTMTLDSVQVLDLGAPFDAAQGLTMLNVAAPSGSYTGTADAVIDIDLTAPGTLISEAGIVYRRLDANNYWRAYFNTSGAFRVDSVSGGVATNRINVAGVIAAGQTRTIRIVCDGSLHDAYTLAGATWTVRGSQVNVSHQNSQTTIVPEVGAGWTAANLRSTPRTSATYDALDTP